MHTLADFLNHGLLPFVGRETETARLVDFWRGTFEATELRVLLLTGEAGIGKSRLLERVMGRIVGDGGSVVHVKIYPESTASFLSLVAHALWHRDAGRALLGAEPEAKIGAVGSGLQRLARLRPTLFVLEDLHLIGGEGVHVLTRLLSLLADETISLLALARPVELEARGALEPYLIGELLLPGLGREECARIWEEVCGAGIENKIATTLHDATAGNPLALGSALRGALTIENDGESVRGGAQDADEWSRALAGTLGESLGLLTDGMTVHLSREELDAARRLASLGEIFSREAAEVLLADSPALIASLLFNGIVATAVAPPEPLPGEQSVRPPLGFTHTLLHRQLVDSVTLDAERLVRVIAAQPLYSILPFRILSERSWSIPSLDPGTIARAFDRSIRAQIAIGRSALRKHSGWTWLTAVRLMTSRLGTWDPEEWDAMLVRTIHHRINMVKREPEEIRRPWLDYLLSVTAGSSSDELVKGRFHALFHRDLFYSAGNSEMTRELWEEAEELIVSRPHLRFSFAYTDFVIAACVGAYDNGDTAMMRRVERRAEELLASAELPERVRSAFERKIRPPLLKLYDDERELDLRLSHVAAFEHTVERNEIGVWSFCIELLGEIAEVERLRRICEETFPSMREQGLAVSLVDSVARLYSVLAGSGESFSAAESACEHALSEMPEGQRKRFAGILLLPLVDAALLLDDPAGARRIVEHHSVADDRLGPVRRTALVLHDPDPRSALLSLRESGGKFAPLIDSIVDGVAFDLPAVRALFRAPVLRLTDVLEIRVAAAAVEYAHETGSSDSLPADLRTDIREALTCSLEWLAAPHRSLFDYMRPVLERGEKYFSRPQRQTWKKKIEDLAAERDERQREKEEGDGRHELTMLGTITLRTADGTAQRFQGARARRLLAMMVIDRMLAEPLSPDEFCRIVAGDSSIELDSARDIVKMSVKRVRDLIGNDMVLTESGAPSLNSRLVKVDLLEAKEFLKRAGEALRRSSPMQAKESLMAALEITLGEVLFPSLYDDFIEAVRTDFENELRTTAIDVAEMLSREGGVEDAAEVLHRAGEAIPGDKTLPELHAEMLRQAERMPIDAEAENV